MSVLYPLLAAWLFGCGIYMILSRSIARIVMGLSLIGTSINLMIFQTGRIGPMQPPIIPEGAKAHLERRPSRRFIPIRILRA